MLQLTEIKSMDELIGRMAPLAAESPTYQKLAQYIEGNYLRIIFMTAEEAASQSGVSQGSVSRFCIALGYRGYNDFLKSLQKVVSDEITAPQRLVFSNSSSIHTDDIAAKEAANICALNDIMAGEAYEKMVKVIVGTPKLIIMSARVSATLLPYMKYILDKMRDNVEVITPESEQWEKLYLKDAADTAIISIGFPRYSRKLVEKLKEAKELGFSIYSITDSRLSPLVTLSEETVFVPVTISSVFDIYSTPMAFINLMLRDASKNIPCIEKRFDKIEEYDEKQGTYYKPGRE